MYLLPLLALVGPAFCGPLSTEVKNTVDNRPALYRLPIDTIPTFYDVTLFFNPDQTSYFTGTVSIRVLPVTATNEIVLHAMAMTIADNAIQVFSDREPTVNLVENFTLATDDTHFLRIRLNRQLTVMQPVTVNIAYTAEYAENMFGVYVSTYEEDGQQRRLVTSQLQPTFARRAFPCYDEPAFKAIFRTTIYAPPQYTVVRSNMDLRTDTLKPEVPGFTKHEFDDTLIMSTYLIAYLVSNFEYVGNENEANPLYHIPFRVYSRPGTKDSAAFALDFGQRNMKALEEYTDFKYEFPKMDKAAVPDFAAGAMENWGLVIYREAALLVTDGVTTTNTKQNVGRIICHENVHQWFGNEVGPASWTYTWLNEGFANFFENYATDLVLPEWRMMDQFVVALQNVFQSDAVLSVNPMTHPVYSPSEIISTFNAVAYQKSGSVIRMMQHFLTPEVFRQGLIYYIKTMSRDAAAPIHLYAGLQRALDESGHSIPYALSTVMTRWTEQGGFPVLTITRSAPTAESVVVSQERFLTDKTLTAADRWHVPINWVLSSDPNFTDTKPMGWIPPSFPAQSVNIPGLTNAEWYIFNKQQTGYYRVNYDLRNWEALAKVLNDTHEVIHLINRGQILDDAFNLARNGRLNYKYAFEISRYLVKEKDYIPWASVNPALNYLDIVLSESDVYAEFRYYVLNMTAPLYTELGFNVVSGEEHVTPYHRNIILDLNCRLGNQDCISTAQALLDASKNNPSSLNPDIQTLVYCSGLRGGSVENFDYLWNLYLSSSDSSQQSILLNSMGCTSNEASRTRYLNQVIDVNSQVREQDRHTILVSVINASPANMNAALDFVIENFHLIQPRVQGLTGTTNILNAFARRLTSQEHSTKVDELFNRHQAIFTAGELASIAAIRENIAAALTWNNENAAVVEDWLTDNYGDGNGASAITSSLVLLVSVVVAIFNY